MPMIYMNPSAVADVGRRMRDMALELSYYAEQIRSKTYIPAEDQFARFEAELDALIDQARTLSEEFEDLGRRMMREAEEWGQMDASGRDNFEGIAEIVAPLSKANLPRTYGNVQIPEEGVGALPGEEPLTDFRIPPANPNTPRIEGWCAQFVRLFRGDHTLPENPSSAFEYIYNDAFANMRETLAPGIGDLRQQLEPGYFVVYDRGQFGADQVNGHVSVITAVYKDYVVVQETPWGSHTGISRHIPISELSELTFIGYPPGM